MGLNVSASLNGTQSSVAVINVRQGEKVFSLIYDLYEEPQWSAPIQSHIFSDEQLICLYDEVDLLNDVTFSHEILVSDGRVLRLVFFQFNFFVSRTTSSIPKVAAPASGSRQGGRPMQRQSAATSSSSASRSFSSSLPNEQEMTNICVDPGPSISVHSGGKNVCRIQHQADGHAKDATAESVVRYNKNRNVN